MVKSKPVGSILGLVGTLFNGRICKGWRKVEMRSGRGAVKEFGMLDGTMGSAGITNGFLMIFGHSGKTRDFKLLKPMHVLLEVSVENLSRFYPPEHALEIYSAYNRFNRLRRTGKAGR